MDWNHPSSPFSFYLTFWLLLLSLLSIPMASRDLTAVYFERRTAALKRRTAGSGGTGHADTGNGLNGSTSTRLTAGGTTDVDDGHSLMLMEVSSLFFLLCRDCGADIQYCACRFDIENMTQSLFSRILLSSLLALCFNVSLFKNTLFRKVMVSK